MKVSVEKTSSLGRKVSVQIPAESVEAERNEQIQSLAKSIQLKGFRKGKVPERVILQRFGKNIDQEAIGKLMERSVKDALEQENLKPATQPVVEDIKDEKGQDLSYTMTFEVFPEIELKPFSEIELEKQVAEITEADIDKGIEKLQKQFSSWKEVNRKSKSGDGVLVDFVGEVDGKPFDGGSGKDMMVEIGEGQFIPGFEDGLIGVESGQSLEVPATFPENYTEETLAGKNAIFKVEVKEVKERELAPLDEKFAENIGIENGGESEIREKIKENMTNYLAQVVQGKMREQALEKLLEHHPMEVPSSLLEEEKKQLMLDSKKGKTPDEEDEVSKDVEEKNIAEAKKRVSLSILIQKVAETHKLKPTDLQLQQKIMEWSSVFNNPEEIQKLYHGSQELMQGVHKAVLADTVSDFIIETATIQEKSSTFHEIATSTS